jgi:hypothetical protein
MVQLENPRALVMFAGRKEEMVKPAAGVSYHPKLSERVSLSAPFVVPVLPYPLHTRRQTVILGAEPEIPQTLIAERLQASTPALVSTNVTNARIKIRNVDMRIVFNPFCS